MTVYVTIFASHTRTGRNTLYVGWKKTSKSGRTRSRTVENVDFISIETWADGVFVSAKHYGQRSCDANWSASEQYRNRHVQGL